MGVTSGRGSFEQLEIACVVVDNVVVCVPFAFSILSSKCFHSPNPENSLSFAFCS